MADFDVYWTAANARSRASRSTAPRTVTSGSSTCRRSRSPWRRSRSWTVKGRKYLVRVVGGPPDRVRALVRAGAPRAPSSERVSLWLPSSSWRSLRPRVDAGSDEHPSRGVARRIVPCRAGRPAVPRGRTDWCGGVHQNAAAPMKVRLVNLHGKEQSDEQTPREGVLHLTQRQLVGMRTAMKRTVSQQHPLRSTALGSARTDSARTRSGGPLASANQESLSPLHGPRARTAPWRARTPVRVTVLGAGGAAARPRARALPPSTYTSRSAISRAMRNLIDEGPDGEEDEGPEERPRTSWARRV